MLKFKRYLMQYVLRTFFPKTASKSIDSLAQERFEADEFKIYTVNVSAIHLCLVYECSDPLDR
jgi:hypothetical protein